MRRDRRSIHERSRRFAAYMTDEGVPSDEKRGLLTLALLAHAIIYLLLTAVQAIWVAATAFRVWRRREAGLTATVKSGVHRPTLVVILAATLIYEITRRFGVATLSQRASEHVLQRTKST